MSVASLVKKANTLKTMILRYQSQIIAWNSNTVKITEIKLIKQSLEDQNLKLVELFENICDVWKDDEMAAHEPTFNTLFDSLHKMQVHVGELLAAKEAAAKKQIAPSFKLERIKLPIFKGAVSEWQSFHDLFKSSVDQNPTLSGAEKMIHLQSCLVGEAASIVSSFQATDAHYKQAWDLVIKRYSNKREIIFAHIRKFDEMKSNYEESAVGLRGVSDTINEFVRSLRCLGVPVDEWDLIIIYLALKKVSKETKKQWLLEDKNTLPALNTFIQYLELRARALADNETSTSKYKVGSSNHQKKSSSHLSSSSPNCPNCSESHHLYKCKSFMDLSVPERKEFIGKKQLCYNCMFSGHSVAKCRMDLSCKKCGKRHHTLLHIESVGTRTPSVPVSSKSQELIPAVEQNNVISTHCAPQNKNCGIVLMGTLLVSVKDSLGQKQKCRVFMDPGSESNFVSEYCVDRLGLNRRKTCVTVTGISGSPGETATGIVKLNLLSNSQEFQLEISALILKKITNKLPRAKCNNHWAHLEGLTLGDPTFNTPGHVDVLLGAGTAVHIMLPGIRTGPAGTPSAQNTKFGWMLSGYVRSDDTFAYHIVVQSCHVKCKVNETCLDSALSRFWELEDQDVPSMSISEEDAACQVHFESTHRRNMDGGYTVELPFKSNVPVLGHSRNQAIKRFSRVEKRLSQNSAIKHEYVKCMRESISSNFLELIPSEEPEKSEEVSYYMPHREVVKESSSSTKVRIVYDASSKSSSGVSLNDILMTGPKLQSDLVPLLIRFRSHLVAMSADIVKFYPQFKVDKKHVDYQRLVWREHPDLPIQDYRMLRVTFGVTAASYLAIRCLQQLAEDESSEFPWAAEVIKGDFLVDNLLTGTCDLESAHCLQQEILQVMKRGNLSLSKWSSNLFQVVEAVPPAQRESEFPLSIKEDEAIKTIGLLWNPTTDSFGVSINVPDNSTVLTKRTILSSIAKTFDPLGWLSPVTIRAKILMQSLWKLDLDWDTPVPHHVCKLWLTYCEDLILLQTFRISRCIVGPVHLSSTSGYELHGFSDASLVAYSACVYLRTGYHVNLIVAKTKVAPVKSETIPRLELCGAVLLSKLMKSVQDCLKLEFRVIRCWTDSTIVLDWLSSSGKQSIFIYNRVRKIKSVIPRANWDHVPGTENPADAASRGVASTTFLNSQLWLQGPLWLSVTNFPDSPVTVLAHVTMTIESTLSMLIDKTSSFLRLKRIVGYCHRFIRNCKLNQDTRAFGNLSVNELNIALNSIIIDVQRQSFPIEIQQCKINLNIKSRLKFLTPFLDSSGILRVGGRLANSVSNMDKKHPILLPQNHPFTETMVRYFHLNHAHAGPQLLLAIVRDQFWVVRGPEVAKRIVRRCVVCFKQNPATMEQLMGQLPSSRVTPSKPFSKTGIDYAGPFTLCLTPGRKPKLIKSYIAVFVCMATKAVHLELVGDLSTPSFVAALTRFVARRGLPTDIYCDGGKNFIGARNEMNEFSRLIKSSHHQNSIHNHLTSKHVRYHINPPLSPHHGGLWEAAVKSMKRHLKRVIENRHISIEEFLTLLHQIEACLNSRPLTQMSADPNDFSVLTPGHFLIGEAPLAIPQHDLTDLNINRLSRWQAVQQMFQHFWRRWNAEYLQSLQASSKWFNSKPNLEVGILVLVRDDEPTWGLLKWKLGRIIKTYPGSDGNVRICDIKTGLGSLCQRPIVKLSPLPIYS